MKSFELIAGTRFGRLVVISRGRGINGAQWICRCDCGVKKEFTGSNLRTGNSQSCGCLRKETLANRAAERNRKRGSRRCDSTRKTPEYYSWHAMHTRCSDSSHKDWKRYGGRGVIVAERWNVFENFLADMGPRPNGTSIDRIDNDGNYEPGNCRWASSKTQRRNSSQVRCFIYLGQTFTLTELANNHGMKVSTLWTRLKSGASLKDALTRPLRKSTKTT